MAVKSLFTNTIDQDTAQIVRAIPAPAECIRFQSAPTSYDQSGQSWTQWAAAWKSPQTGLWTLETYQRFSDGEDSKTGTNSKKTIAKNVSFFDALYFCASEELSRKGAGAVSAADLKTKAPHYKDVATLAHQPLDVQGIPHPAAHGSILTDGLFDDAANDLAENTATVQLDMNKAARAPQLVDFSNLDVSAEAANTGQYQSLADTQIKKEQLIDKLNDSKQRLHKYRLAIAHDVELPPLGKEVIKNTFTFRGHESANVIRGAGAMLTFFSVLFAVAPPAILSLGQGAWLGGGMLATTALQAPAESYIKAATGKIRKNWNSYKLDRRIKSLPDSGLKNELASTRTQFRALEHFYRAANALSDGGYSHKSKVRYAFKQVAKGARIAGMSDIETEQLRMAVAQQKFPNKEVFLEKMSEIQKTLCLAFVKAAEDVKQGGDITALEHKQEMPIDLQIAQKTKVPQPK